MLYTGEQRGREIAESVLPQITGDVFMLALSGWLILALVALTGGLAGGMIVNMLADVLPRERWERRLGCCPKCGHALPRWWYMPVLPVFKRSTNCQQCTERLPRRHIWVGIAAPLALLLLLWPISEDASAKLPPAALLALYGLATLTLLLIFVTDLEHHLILDVIIYPAIMGLLAMGIILNHQMLFFMVVGAVISGALFGVCYALAYLIYHTDALGLGDVKLAVFIGLLIGWPAIINALFCGTLAGAATGIVLMIAGRANRHTMIPLGTGLSLGAFLALLLAPLLW